MHLPERADTCTNAILRVLYFRLSKRIGNGVGDTPGSQRRVNYTVNIHSLRSFNLGSMSAVLNSLKTSNTPGFITLC